MTEVEMETGIDRDAIHETTRGSFDGTMAFPEVVARLAAAGVERYHVDLARREKVSYAAAASARDPLPLDAPPPIADAFSAEGVREAIDAVQRGEMGYPAFLRRIMEAGTAAYTVFIRGRMTIYSGREGDFHVERFPAPH